MKYVINMAFGLIAGIILGIVCRSMNLTTNDFQTMCIILLVAVFYGIGNLVNRIGE